MTYRSIKLRTIIANEVKQSGPFIEVYPFASKVRSFGKTMPGKTTNQVVIFLEEKPGDI